MKFFKKKKVDILSKEYICFDEIVEKHFYQLLEKFKKIKWTERSNAVHQSAKEFDDEIRPLYEKGEISRKKYLQTLLQHNKKLINIQFIDDHKLDIMTNPSLKYDFI